MKVKPLQWDSTVEFWPWGNFDLEFLASFCGLSILSVFGLVLSLLVKTRDKGNRENNHTVSKKTPSKQGKSYFIENSWSIYLLESIT